MTKELTYEEFQETVQSFVGRHDNIELDMENSFFIQSEGFGFNGNIGELDEYQSYLKFKVHPDMLDLKLLLVYSTDGMMEYSDAGGLLGITYGLSQEEMAKAGKIPAKRWELFLEEDMHYYDPEPDDPQYWINTVKRTEQDLSPVFRCIKGDTIEEVFNELGNLLGKVGRWLFNMSQFFKNVP